MRAFRLAYDGRPFHGFQRQPDVPTVEDAIFDALRELDVLDGGKPPNYAAAGRTDAGVSAVAQTVGFEAPDWLTPRALNSELPMAVRAWAHATAPPEFHATHDAVSRAYTYHLSASEADAELAHEVVSALSGEHDFHNLTPDDHNTVRSLGASVEREGDFLHITLRAGGFPRQLVRRVVSLVQCVATGAAPLSKVDRVLSSESLAGPDGIGPAPAAPLVLTAVEYPDVDFRTDDAANARRVFEERRVGARTAARVAGAVADGIGGE